MGSPALGEAVGRLVELHQGRNVQEHSKWLTELQFSSAAWPTALALLRNPGMDGVAAQQELVQYFAAQTVCANVQAGQAMMAAQGGHGGPPLAWPLLGAELFRLMNTFAEGPATVRRQLAVAVCDVKVAWRGVLMVRPCLRPNRRRSPPRG